MGYVIRMPQLGMTMETGIVVEWVADLDDRIEAGEVIAIVESEKTTNEIEAREDGMLIERFVEIDEPVEPGYPIGYLGDPEESVPTSIRDELESTSESVATSDSEDSSKAREQQPISSDGQRISPRARSALRDQGLSVADIDSVQGSGPGGAIVEADVESLTVRSEASGRGVLEAVESNTIRSAIAEKMTRSAREVPQVTVQRRVHVGRVQKLKNSLEAASGESPSYEDFVIAAVARALTEHPLFNAIYEEGTHLTASSVNIGVAVAVDEGLITPVIRDTDELTVSEIATARRRAVETARDGTYTMDDLAEGTFTVTNLGPFGIETFDPLLNVPEVGILGIGALTGDDEVGIDLSLTFDHRAVDGADAARFLETVATAIEKPRQFLQVDDGPVKEHDAPDHRTVSVRSTGHASTEIRTRGFVWQSDEPPSLGGNDQAPTPVDQFLGSLGACLSVTIRAVADRRDIPIDALSIEVSGDPDDGPIEAIDVAVTIDASADRTDLERVVETAERACYVSRLIDDDISRSMSLTVGDG